MCGAAWDNSRMVAFLAWVGGVTVGGLAVFGLCVLIGTYLEGR
jgi:hypothetical protein